MVKMVICKYNNGKNLPNDVQFHTPLPPFTLNDLTEALIVAKLY